MSELTRWPVLLQTCVLLALAGQPALAAIEAEAGWSRQTPPGVKVGVGYFTLRNNGNKPRELLKITAPQAANIEINRTSTDAQGVSHMWPVGKLEVAPGQTLKLAPNGLHIMLLGLKQPLQAGQTVPVTMLFADEPPVNVNLSVRSLTDVDGPDEAHGANAMHDMHDMHDMQGMHQGSKTQDMSHAHH